MAVEEGQDKFQEFKESRKLERSKSAVAKSRLQMMAHERGKSHIQGSQVVKAIWMCWISIILFFMVYFKLYKMKELYTSVLAGSVLGFLGTAVYHQNQKWKHERNQRLAMVPGKKGVQALLHHIPTWLSFTDVEKMEWLNRIIAAAWPFYDAAICEEVKRQVEPMMDEYRPPFIKKIYFKKLTFGDAPIRIVGVRVLDKSKEAVEIEVGFRWSGDASIFLAIELMAGGSATRMVPKVTDLSASGRLRISLAPLLPEIPGFGAATVALMRPPIVKFHLDFGAAFGGSLSAKAVVAWLDPFLRNTITGMMVWPRRIVVPILPADVTGPLDDLYLRHKGALEIDVLSATKLPKMDQFGSADPFVELFVDPNGDHEKTKRKNNTLEPVWKEKKWLLVQEPTTQCLHLEVQDVDRVNIKEMLRFNVIKGATSVLNATSLIGRAKVDIQDMMDTPGKPQKIVLPLGIEEFSNPSGCGGGKGELTLKVAYWPLEKITGHADAKHGALLVTLISGHNLPIADVVQQSSDIYAVFSCQKVRKESPTIRSTCNPEWVDCKFEWYKIPKDSILKIKVFDFDRLSADDLLGKIEIPVKEIAHAPMGDVSRSWNLEIKENGGLQPPEVGKPSQITMRIQWVPFKDIYI